MCKNFKTIHNNQLDDYLTRKMNGNYNFKKMKTLKIILVFLCSVTIFFETYSQGRVFLHFGPSIPVADFRDVDFNSVNTGGAAVGINIGLQYIHPITESGLGVFGGVEVNYNALSKDMKNDIEEFYQSRGIHNGIMKFNRYINIPISAGLNYTHQANDNIGVFANAGLALNFLKMTDAKIGFNSQVATTRMDFASNIGFKIGTGILINQKTSVSIHYLGLGEHDIEGEVRTRGRSDDIDAQRSANLLTLTLGFGF